MNDYAVYIRPLVLSDAQISFRWRNNPEVWEFTGSRPNKYITPEIETEWLKNTFQRDNERRFAICLKRNDQYIGNVQLTDIFNNKAQFHIFIGEPDFWGKGIATQATNLIIHYGFSELGLDEIYLEVNAANLSAIAVYKKIGFVTKNEKITNFLKMELTRKMFKTSNMV